MRDLQTIALVVRAYRFATRVPLLGELARAAARAYSRDRSLRSALKIAMRLGAKSVAPRQPVPQHILAKYRAAQTLLALGRLKELGIYYQDQAMAGAIAYAPLKYLEDLATSRASDSDPNAFYEEIVTEFPDFSEAWLELGYASLDAGNYRAAIAHFDRALAATMRFTPNGGDANAQAKAAAAKAMALEALGETAAAREAYSEALRLGDSRPTTYLRFAHWLRANGEPALAVHFYSMAMGFDGSAATDPGLPRSLEQLKSLLESSRPVAKVTANRQSDPRAAT